MLIIKKSYSISSITNKNFGKNFLNFYFSYIKCRKLFSISVSKSRNFKFYITNVAFRVTGKISTFFINILTIHYNNSYKMNQVNPSSKL